MHIHTLRRGFLPLAVLAGLAACDSPTEELPPPRVQVAASVRSVVAGNTLQVTATVTEEDGTASTRRVSWESSNGSVATVSNSGLVTGVAAGDARITASVGGSSAALDVHVMPAAKSTTPPSTFLSFASTPGDWVGGGQTQRYNFSTGSWTATASPNRNEIHVSYDGGISTWWHLDLSAPQGQALAVGTYENATRWPFQASTAPGLSFTGSGRGCNTSRGRFVIHDLAIDPQGQVHRLHATFRQHCEGGASYLDGEINILQYPWR